MSLKEIESYIMNANVRAQDFSILCKKAILGMYLLRKELEKSNIFISNNFSITYSARTERFHWYIEGRPFSISFAVFNHTIVYRRFYNKYQEGYSNVILKYSDKARGKSAWYTENYFRWIDSLKNVICKHPLYFYSDNFNVIEFCMQNNINIIKE